MYKQPIRAAAHKACCAGILAGFSVLACVQPALAQGTAPANSKDEAPSEAARKAAASPYRFILLNANAPTRKPAAAPVAAPAPAPAAEPARRAPAVETAAVTRPAVNTPAPAPTQAAPVEVAAPQPAVQAPPAPAVAALTQKPPEPAPIAEVKRELIPIRTDEPRMSAAMIRDGVSGKVVVQFDVKPDGSTGDVKVVSTTNRALNRPSLDAVSGWKFRPVDEVLTVQTELVYTPSQ